MPAMFGTAVAIILFFQRGNRQAYEQFQYLKSGSNLLTRIVNALN